jgi:hypothetical protein
MKRLILAALAVLALTGCGQMDRGTVTDKVYEPENTQTMWLPITVGQTCSGNPAVCTPITMPFPFEVYDGPDWVLKLRDGDKDGKRYVSEETFNATKIGSYFDKDVVPSPGFASDSNNWQKEVK